MKRTVVGDVVGFFVGEAVGFLVGLCVNTWHRSGFVRDEMGRENAEHTKPRQGLRPIVVVVEGVLLTVVGFFVGEVVGSFVGLCVNVVSNRVSKPAVRHLKTLRLD